MTGLNVHIGRTVTIDGCELDPGTIGESLTIQKIGEMHIVTLDLLVDDLTVDIDDVPRLSTITLKGPSA